MIDGQNITERYPTIAKIIDWMIVNIVCIVRPKLKDRSKDKQLIASGDILASLMILPVAISGFYWLIRLTRGPSIISNLPQLICLSLLMFLMNRIGYFLIMEIRTDRYGSSEGSFENLILWSGFFILGPVVLWAAIANATITCFVNSFGKHSRAILWRNIRHLVMNTARDTVGILISWSVFVHWLVVFPIHGFTPRVLILTLGLVTFSFLVNLLIHTGYLVLAVWTQLFLLPNASISRILKFAMVTFGLEYLPIPFALILSTLYVQNGISGFLVMVTALSIIGYMTHRLSWSVENNRLQARQLQKIDEVGRAIITSTPEIESLKKILSVQLPMMFPSEREAIWLFPDHFIYKRPADWWFEVDLSLEWLLNRTEAYSSLEHEILPWTPDQRGEQATIIAPILDVEHSKPIGGIMIELRNLAQAWDKRALARMHPPIHTLGDLVASAIRQIELNFQTLKYEKQSQDLRSAGQIQASLLPRQFPNIPGWEFAVTFQPASETSGDFFDFIPLPDGKIGVVIADVADKGIGPALYMALTRTLIRTFTLEYETDPDIILSAVNERILKDTNANLFVTAFLGIIHSETGLMTYCNAGHCPPILVHNNNNDDIEKLSVTGMALGIEEDEVWLQESVQLLPGNILLLYTDGIIDAQNEQGEFFSETRVLDILKQKHITEINASDIQDRLLRDIYRFIGDTPQYDDITSIVISFHKT